MSTRLAPEQERFARWLDWGTSAGLTLLVASFLAYALGLLDPLVTPQELTQLWTRPLGEYLAATGAPTGWAWLGLLGKGDYLNLAGIAVLALVALACYAGMIPTLLGSGERLQALLAIAQVLVLLAAASGLLAGGH